MRCRYCGGELAAGNRYCPSCGQLTGGLERVMPEQVPERAPLRSAPATSAVATLDARPASIYTTDEQTQAPLERPAREALYIDPIRLLCLSLLSGGTYSFYWMFLTWKQLRSETHGDHHAIWHAFATNVPIYGWFRSHRHLEVIRDLSMQVGLVPSFIPIIVVFLFGVGRGVDLFASRLGLDPLALVIVHIVAIGFNVALLIWVQNDLNRYWQKTRGERLSEVGFGVGEIAVTLLGVATWLPYILLYV